MKKRQSTQRHRLYGDIPLIERRTRFEDREDVVWYEHDPAYQPLMPAGAVRGDVSRQVYARGSEIPKYFYVDEARTCVQCEEPFVFTATEQKFWYEKLQFSFDSLAIRCARCRKTRRVENALRRRMAEALDGLETRPGDPRLLLDLATATVRYRERTGEGKLDRALAACRKAARAWPESAEPQFWEAKCHRLAGREDKARKGFEAFIERARKVHRLAKLVAEAERELA